MRRIGETDSWMRAFAVGLFIRPVLIVPMVSSGPVRDSSLAILGFGSVLLFHIVLAGAVLVGNRLALALGILTALIGPGVAAIGHLAGMPAPWPLAMGVVNVVLAVVGIEAWRKPRVSAPRDPTAQ